MSEPAISVVGVWKQFRLYHERNQSLKIAVLRGRRARYDEFWALRDVSFDVAPGSAFGIIGENGSGKSTMLKCMARILRPEQGAIRVQGKVSALLELGAGFHPELSGRDNVYLNGAILGLSRKQLDRRFDEIVSFAGIERFIDSPVKNYSSGMYVRLGFSVAINVEPDVLLIDEVMAVGDAEFQERCRAKIEDFRDQGKTIVLVSHSLPLVSDICDEVALLDHGELRALGPPETVIDRYMSDVHAKRPKPAEAPVLVHARVVGLELLDAAGRVIDKASAGAPVTFRLHYEVDEPVARPVFGLAVFTADGTEITRPNTWEAGAGCERLDHGGVVDLVVDRLPLVPGSYELAPALYDATVTHPFNHVERIRLDVGPGQQRENHGFFAMGGRWEGQALDGPRS